jgi:hypothetical protein
MKVATKARKPAADVSLFDALSSAVSPVVKHYRDDLNIHDQAWIADNAGVPFLHFARECGTHLWGLMPVTEYPNKGVYVPHLFGQADREQLIESLLSAVRYCVKSEVTEICHYYDGKRLRRIEPAKAIDIALEYAARIRREFHN